MSICDDPNCESCRDLRRECLPTNPFRPEPHDLGQRVLDAAMPRMGDVMANEITSRMSRSDKIQFLEKSVDKYDPCPCGSGKKFRWCCFDGDAQDAD